jgi:imidazolonepropionase-like amidohydrolase
VKPVTQDSDVIDLHGATLIDGTGAAAAANTSIRIEGGRIAAIWQHGRDVAPQRPADRTIDVTGLYVVPGLIDAHCHISYGEGRTAEEVDVYGGAEWAAVRAVWNASKVLHAGVTSFCDPGSTWNVAVTCRDAIENAMYEGPRIFAAGRHIVADGGFADYYPSWVGMPQSAEGVLCPTRDDMLREVRSQAKNRVDLVKISGDSQAQERDLDAGPCFVDEELRAIVDLAHQLGKKTTIHARYGKTVKAAVRAGVDWIIHASYLNPDDIGILRDTQTPVCPTITFTSNIVEFGRDVGVDPNYIEVKKRELDALAKVHSRAYEAGVVLMAGSESGFSVTPYGDWHGREIESMVKYVGMSTMDALLSATRNNAVAFGWGGTAGTITVGAAADLIVLRRNPLEDIAVLGKPDQFAMILKGGKSIAPRMGHEITRRRMSHERGFPVSAGILHWTASVA